MLGSDQVIGLGAKRVQDWFRESGPKHQRRHPTGLPHQQEHKKVQDQKNDCEDVRTRKDSPRISQVVAFVNRQLSRRFLSHFGSANVTAGLAGANQRTTITTNGWSTGIIWWSIRQRNEGTIRRLQRLQRLKDSFSAQSA